MSEKFGHGKTLCRRGYRYSLLNFFSHSAKKFREVNHSKFQKNSGLKNFSAEEGDITILCWNFFSPSAKKFREGNHSMFQINSGMENFMQKKDISLFSVGTFFSHSADKFRGRN